MKQRDSERLEVEMVSVSVMVSNTHFFSYIHSHMLSTYCY